MLALLAAATQCALEIAVGGFWIPQGVGVIDIPRPELAFFATYLVLGATCWAGLTAALGSSALGNGLLHVARRLLARPGRVALGCACATLGGSLLFRALVLRGQVLTDDELTYDFMASTLLEGRVSNPPPIPYEFLRNQFVYVSETAWHGKYPIGHALVLAAGRLLGAQALVVPALGALGVLVTYALGRRLLDARAAAAACLLLVLSPHYLWTHATQLSQPTAMLCMLLAALGVLRLLETQRLGWAALCGSALGFGLLTRPLPTLFFVPAVLLAYVVLLPPGALGGEPRRRARELLVAGATLAVGLGALMWLNAVHWGSPFTSGAEVVHSRTGAFETRGFRIPWSIGGAVLRENFWLHGWPVSLAFLPFARFRRGAVLLWALVGSELIYRLVVPKTVVATTGPTYLLEVVPLLCLATVAGALGWVRRARARGAAPGAPERWVVSGVVAGCLVGAALFVPTQLATVLHATDVRLEAYATLDRAGFQRALVFASAVVAPDSGDSWAYYAPNPSPRLDDDRIWVRYRYDADGYAQMHALWRERFADRRAVLFLLTPEGSIELRELAADPKQRPALPPQILFAQPM